MKNKTNTVCYFCDKNLKSTHFDVIIQDLAFFLCEKCLALLNSAIDGVMAEVRWGIKSKRK